MVVAVIVMGFCLSWLLLVDLGTDPCTLMNVAIADTIGMSLGNWQALLNTVLLVIVVIFGGRNLGFGTLANMFLVGYSIDFFSWVWAKILPVDLFSSWGVRVAVLIPALAVFVLAVAVYMDMDMGTAPYDAIPIIISKYVKRFSFRTIRMVFDFTVVVIGMCFGGRLGIVTFLMALTLGPVIAWVGDLDVYKRQSRESGSVFPEAGIRFGSSGEDRDRGYRRSADPDRHGADQGGALCRAEPDFAE